MSNTLFDADHLVVDVPEPEHLSADRRRTLRQARAVAAGVHPLGLLFPSVRMHPDAARDATADDPKALPFRCGSCCLRQLASHHNRSHPKCTKDWPARASHSAATDVRAWWPACADYVGNPAIPAAAAVEP